MYLIKEELVNIHDAILSESGGDSGIYEGLIDLCVESPQREVYGYEPHKTLLEKAAALMYNVNTLHPFIDGNKRTAYVATNIFLELNGRTIGATKEEGVEISLKIANGNMGIKDITSWLEEHTREIPL
ncbi:MAG: type II toxin-antitoxin system death-on-curing family toxin [Euryarchaeota archaeon]|nr:type II toxin-antitoxin system death-on-curing family toxin [Euryarchaeota archaeon]